MDYMEGNLQFLEGVREKCGDIALVQMLVIETYCIVSRPTYFEQGPVGEPDAFTRTDDFDVLSGTGVLAAEGEPWR
jgi:hypothetical protein